MLRLLPCHCALALAFAIYPAAAQEPPADIAEAPPAAEEAADLANPNPLSGLDIESLSATRSLPLFTPSRKPPVVPEPVVEAEPEPAPSEPEPEQPPPSLQLVGIVLTVSTQTALLRDPSSNEVHRISPGDEYEGWKLSIVDASSIELRSGDRVEGLKMFESFPAPHGGFDDYDLEGQGPPSRIGPPPPQEPAEEEFDNFDEFDDETEDDDVQGGEEEEQGLDVEPTGAVRERFAPELGGTTPIPEEGPLQPNQGIEPTQP